MYGMEVRDIVDFKKSLWNSLLRDAIYRIVFDFGLRYYRIEDKRFQVIYAEDMPKGYYDMFIREWANIVSESEQERFLQSFTEQRLKNMPRDVQQEFVFAYSRNKKTEKKMRIKVTVFGKVKDMVAEFRIDEH